MKLKKIIMCILFLIVTLITANPTHAILVPTRTIDVVISNVENIEDTSGLLKTIYNAWEELTNILSKCFPEMEHDDWNNVELNELIPVTMDILKYSFGEILNIPRNEEKNLNRA